MTFGIFKNPKPDFYFYKWNFIVKSGRIRTFLCVCASFLSMIYSLLVVVYNKMAIIKVRNALEKLPGNSYK